ncbi:hypothetical protein [Microbacterium testaceum]|uniref:hypothetical protein n=1 Tax=Microbacterium testaceum TaxID=2033 RepID=UPI003815DB31
MSTPDTADFDDLLADHTPEQGSAWEVGETVTIMIAGTTAAFGVPLLDLSKTFRRGDQVTITQATLDHRRELLDLIDNPDEQLRRWGEQRFVRGAVDLERWHERGDAEWILARDAARAVAADTIDPVERAHRYAAISERFGAAPQAKTTQYRDRAAERRLAEDLHRRAQQPRAVHRSTAD